MNDKLKNTLERVVKYNDYINKVPNRYPMIPLRDMVLFPNSVSTLEVGRLKSIQAIEYALKNDGLVFFVTQKISEVAEPEKKDLYAIGTIGCIKQYVKLNDNVYKITVEGQSRSEVIEIKQTGTFDYAELSHADSKIIGEDEKITEALLRVAKDLFYDYSRLNTKITPDTIVYITNIMKPGFLADAMIACVPINAPAKQSILECADEYERLERVSVLFSKEIEIMTIQRGIITKVRENMDKAQREYFIREQIKVLQEEIGDKDGIGAEINAYNEKIKNAKLSEPIINKLEKEMKRLQRTNSNTAEASVIRDYIELVLDLPWKQVESEKQNLKTAEKVLDSEHYGLGKIKERIVEYLAVRLTSNNPDTPILCLVGPPGVGKTSIVSSIAKALKRKMVRISLGGLRDEAEIRGHRRTYIGAMPGQVIHAFKQAGVKNPVILLDEMDKIGKDFRGDPAAALLEVLDAGLNKTFKDNYLDLPYDISDALFVCTANVTDTIPAALKDRLEIIQISSYTLEEKMSIAQKYLIKKQFIRHAIDNGKLKFKKDALQDIVEHYTKEAGVRQLERHIGTICRKIVKQTTTKDRVLSTVTSENLQELLGAKKYFKEELPRDSMVGVVNGLAWTAMGGTTLSIEVNVMKGSGILELTGNMGEVMKESAKAAISYIRSNSDKLKLTPSFHKETDIHIHIPEGAVPKDGPSAGITMATAMISALTEIPVRSDVAMTGEVTIRGRVLPIGGLKEKTLAAKYAGIKKVIIPKENIGDYKELPEYITNSMEFVFVKDMSQVIECAMML